MDPAWALRIKANNYLPARSRIPTGRKHRPKRAAPAMMWGRM